MESATIANPATTASTSMSWAVFLFPVTLNSWTVMACARANDMNGSGTGAHNAMTVWMRNCNSSCLPASENGAAARYTPSSTLPKLARYGSTASLSLNASLWTRNNTAQ